MKKIVIFGATGNTGVYLIDYLKQFATDYEIIAVGRRNDSKIEEFFGVKYFSVDISKAEDFEQLPKDDVYAVVHLAGVLPAYLQDNDSPLYINVNILGTMNILNYCKQTNADRILYAQSYADINSHLLEDKVLLPYMTRKINYTNDHATYIISKNAAVDLIEHYSQCYGIKRYILRLPNIYHYSPNKYYYVDGIQKVVSYRYIIDRAINSETIELWGDPTKERDIVYVKDFAQLVFKAIEANNEGGFYNVGTGVGTTFEDQIKGIISVFSPEDKKSEIVYCPDKSDAMEYIMNIDNGVEELGYTPKYDYIAYLEDYKKEMESGRLDALLQ